jgi:hypothetical protein
MVLGTGILCIYAYHTHKENKGNHCIDLVVWGTGETNALPKLLVE